MKDEEGRWWTVEGEGYGISAFVDEEEAEDQDGERLWYTDDQDENVDDYR